MFWNWIVIRNEKRLGYLNEQSVARVVNEDGAGGDKSQKGFITLIRI